MSIPSLEERLSMIERRLDALEKLSHAPVDLTAPVLQALATLLRRTAEDIEAGP